MKKVLITGANSYIGTNVEQWALSKHANDFSFETLDMLDEHWRNKSFSGIDCVFHVAGIAHVKTGYSSDKRKALYYAVNRDLAVETAQKAKREGVKQFVFMSSIIIYGESGPLENEKTIFQNTSPVPDNVYADSKWQADQMIRLLSDSDFTVTIIRPPMIYGKGCRGNFPMLASLAKHVPVFPYVNNQRSMLYIDNLAEFICQIIRLQRGGVYWPQNAEYSNTSEMVSQIAAACGKKVRLLKGMNGVLKIGTRLPGKAGSVMRKVFGNLTVSQSLSIYDFDYQIVDLSTSILRTCGDETPSIPKKSKRSAEH